MKKTIFSIVVGLLLMGGFVFGATGPTTNFWKYNSGALNPLLITWDLGSSTVRIPNGYFDNVDTTTITIGGTVVGNVDMDEYLLLNIGDTRTDFTAGGGLTLYGMLDANGGASFTTATVEGFLTLEDDLILGAGTDINSSVAGGDLSWTLMDDISDSIAFGSAGKPGILAIDTTNGAEVVDMSGNLDVVGAITGATLDTGQGANELYDMNQNVLTTSDVTFDDLILTGSLTGTTVTFTGGAEFTTATFSGSIWVDDINEYTSDTGVTIDSVLIKDGTIDTGQGLNELFDMDQNVLTTSAVIFASLDTGQGANELYDMDQNVLTTSDVNFNNLTLAGSLIGTSFSGDGLSFTTAAISDWLTVGGLSTFGNDVRIDDGVTNSPILYLIDQDNKYLAMAKYDDGTSLIVNNEGELQFAASGDTNDYLAISTSGGNVTLSVTAGDSGDLFIGAGGGDITFNDDVNIGADDAIESLKIHDAGTLTFYDDSDDTTVVIGPVADGTTILGITGSLDVSGSIDTGTLTLASGSITDSAGAISFGDENITINGSLYAGGIDTPAIGTTTPGTGAFTTLTASSTLGVTGVSTFNDNLIIDNTGASVNSPIIYLRGDAAGTEEEGTIQLLQGADPYIRISVDDDSGTPALTGVIDIHDTVISFVNDGSVDIGASGANRPKDYYGSGNITAGGTIAGATLTEGGNAVPNATDTLAFFGATTSAQLYGVISDETGSASGTPLLVFNVNPTLTGATLAGTLNLNDQFATSVGEIGFTSGIRTTTLKGSASATESITYTLPTSDGASGSYIKTNGAGVLSWDTPAGAGDVTAVGDCATGACLDGTDDGGTYITFYNIDSNKTQLIASDTAADLVITLPASSGTLALTTGNVATASALAADPTDCGANTWATTIAASGNLTCSAIAYTGITAMTSNNFDGLISDNTGSGLLVFGTAPTFASTVTIGTNGGTSGQINFIASDNDQGNIVINTSDALTFNSFGGGYIFDGDVLVNSTKYPMEGGASRNVFRAFGTYFAYGGEASHITCVARTAQYGTFNNATYAGDAAAMTVNETSNAWSLSADGTQITLSYTETVLWADAAVKVSKLGATDYYLGTQVVGGDIVIMIYPQNSTTPTDWTTILTGTNQVNIIISYITST